MFLRFARSRAAAVLPLRVEQFSAARDDLSGVLTFHRLDESAVDEAELEVRTPIPHGERRCFDKVRQRSERTLRLAEPKRELRSLLFTGAGIDEPQQQRTWRFIGRRTATDIEHSGGAAGADSSSNASGARLRHFDIGGQRLKVIRRNAAFIASQIGKRNRARLKPKIPEQMTVSFDFSVNTDQERTGRHDFEQPRIGLGRFEHLLRQAKAAGSDDRDRHGNEKPQQCKRCENPEYAGAGVQPCPPNRIISSIGGSGAQVEKEKGAGACAPTPSRFDGC